MAGWQVIRGKSATLDRGENGPAPSSSEVRIRVVDFAAVAVAATGRSGAGECGGELAELRMPAHAPAAVSKTISKECAACA